MKNIYTKKGFTLVETLVAISILLIAVVGPMSAIGASITQLGVARDQMIAVNLAQEGIETVRQIRDSNMLEKWITLDSTTSWDNGLGEACYWSTRTSLTKILDCNPAPVYINNLGFYTQGDGTLTPTIFKRMIQIKDISGAEKKVTSTVSWTANGGTTKQVQVSESIFGINS